MPSPVNGPWFVDHLAFSAISRALRDQRANRRFAHDFVSLWETRAERLTTACATGDATDAELALLSIRTSSAMIGVLALEWCAVSLLRTVKRGNLASAAGCLPKLRDIGRRTCDELLDLSA